MKKIFLVITILLYAVQAFAGWDGDGGWDDSSTKTVARKPAGFDRYTVATLPTMTAGDAGVIVQVTDGDGLDDCLTGLGSDTVLCYWTGSAWSNAGDGSTGIEAGAFDFTTWNANTNGGTKDAIRDQFYVYDTDGDGDIDNVDGAVGGGDITGVGPAGLSAGDALTDGYATSGATLFIFEGTTVDTNEYIINMPAADPAADITWTFPGNTGTGLVGAGAGYSDNILLKVDGASSHLTQATGVTVDDSNNITGVGTISSGAITSTGTSTFADAISPDSADSATIGSATAEWSDLYLADGGVIYGQNDQSNSITSSATGWTFALDAVIGGSDLSLGTAGVKLTGDGDGAITLLGMGDGFDEDITINLDDTSNTAVVSSSTGVTLLSLTSIGITTGAANNFSAGTTTLGTVAGTITDGTASWNAATQALSGFATVAATTSVTSPLYDVSGAAAITVGSADVTAITLQTDDTGDGTDLVLPAQSVNGSEMLNNTVTATQLAATLTMADGDLIDLSGITHTVSTDEGFVLPNWANVVPTSDKKFLAADGSNLKLYNGGWVTIGASAAPTDATYLTLSLDATLSGERVLTESTQGIKFDDTGANGTLTISLDTTEVDATTWSDGANASNVWTFDVSGTDHTMTAGNGVMTFGDAVTVTDTLTATNGIALGTSKSITGTTGLTIGGGTETVAINSSDWDIDATGIATGMGNITSDGVVTATGFTIGSAAITETELEILDGATLSTTDINIIDGISDSGTLTAAELLYVDGVTSAIQTQLDARCLESVFGDAIEADDFVVTGTTLTLQAEIPHIDAVQTISADWEWQDGIPISIGNDNDWEVAYDETTDDRLEFVHTAGAGADVYFDLNDSAADSTYTITNSDVTYEANLAVEGDLSVGGSITSTGAGDSFITLANNTSYAGSGYQIFFEGGNLIAVEAGTEKTVLNAIDGATLTGTSWDFSGVTNFVLPTAAADASGEISMSTGNQLKWHDGTKVVTVDTTVTTDNYVLKYDNASATFNLEADETGGTPAINNVTDATGDATIAFDVNEEMSWQFTGAYTTGTQFLVQQQTGNPTGGVLFEARGADADSTVAKFGDGTNAWTVSTAGLLSNAGTATINLAAANDLTVGGGQIDFDDMAGTANISTTGSIAGNNVNPDAADGATLGTAALEWSDLYLAAGGVIYGENDQSNTLTSSATGWTMNLDLTVTGGDIVLGTTSIFSGGDTASLNNIDAIDSTTEATIEAAIDTLANLTSVGAIVSSGTITSSGAYDVTGATGLDLGSADVTDITLLGQSEDLALTPSADTWTISSSTGVSTIDTGSIKIKFPSVEVDRIPITAFTDGAAPPAAAAVVSSADGAFNCRAFDGASNEDVLFTWKVPPDIDTAQGIKFSVSGVVGAATAPANTEVIAFSLAGVSIGNSDAAGSVGTSQTSSLTADATYAQYDSLDTAFSSAITVTDLAAGETVSFELIRLATTTDTYAQDFHPHTVLIKYVRLHNAGF